jgi:hypothetical protein
MANQWNCGPKGPKTVDEFRQAMKDKIRNKKGKVLIADKFNKDHIYSGHKGDTLTLATELSKLRTVSQSTLLISSLDKSAYEEVNNWIDNIDKNKLSLSGNKWTISSSNSTVPMKNSYKFVTVNIDALKGMNNDDLKTKSRKYIKESLKTPKLACQFTADGTPQIYHLDF